MRLQSTANCLIIRETLVQPAASSLDCSDIINGLGAGEGVDTVNASTSQDGAVDGRDNGERNLSDVGSHVLVSLSDVALVPFNEDVAGGNPSLSPSSSWNFLRKRWLDREQELFTVIQEETKRTEEKEEAGYRSPT